MLCPQRHLLACPKMCYADSSAPGLKPPEEGPAGTFSFGPCQGWHCGKDVSVYWEAGRTVGFGAIPPLCVHLGKRGSGKTPSCTAMYQATSLSLNQPAPLFILFNKMFDVSGFYSGLNQSLSLTKNAENSYSEMILEVKQIKPLLKACWAIWWILWFSFSSSTAVFLSPTCILCFR